MDPSQTQSPEKSDDLEYDLHHLVAFDFHPLETAKLQETSPLPESEQNPFIAKKEENNGKEAYLRELATFGTKSLLNHLFSLEYEDSADGKIYQLPLSNRIHTVLPRAKHIPEEKPKTKWEKFAEEKGILSKKRKRDRMIWDELHQEWRPRYGYGRANDEEDLPPVIELKPGDDPNIDPWSQARENKKARVDKNLKNKLRNSIEANTYGAKTGGLVSNINSSVGNVNHAAGVPIDLRLNRRENKVIPSQPLSVNAPNNTNETAVPKKGKQNLTKALNLAQHSTASIGKFDKKLQDEPVRKIKNVKKKVLSSTGQSAMKDEMALLNKVVGNIVGKVGNSTLANNAKNIVKKAKVNIDALEPQETFKRKKGQGKGKRI